MRKGEDETYWIGGGTAHRCVHNALFGECVVEGCNYNLIVVRHLAAKALKVQDKINSLPEELREKFEQYQMDCAVNEGYSDVVFSENDLAIISEYGLTL